MTQAPDLSTDAQMMTSARALTVVALLSFVTALTSRAAPITFDLRDTSATAEIESCLINRAGVTAVLTPFVQGSAGVLNQTLAGFGINAAGTDVIARHPGQ